jgi:putative SOS response-associated peptidase YedK
MLASAEAFFESDWRSGKAMPTRITLTNSEPMGLTGLWAQWGSSAGETVHSFTILTINADENPFMPNFHKPKDEKRSVVILYDDWLQARAGESGKFLKSWPANMLYARLP